MSDFIGQDLSAERPVFINGTPSVADGEQTPPAIGDTGAPDEATFNDGGELARSPAILSHLAVDLERAGLAGELRAAKIIYLAVTSRLFPWPLSVAHKGPSSAGKSFTVERTLRFFPSEAYIARTAMSERGLVYTNEDLHHRMLVLYEANAIATGRGAYLLRTLLSEGVLRYEVVERTREGCKTRLIEREGPTGLIVTTTETGLDPELETRLMSLTVTDTAAQTKAVMQALARSRSSSDAVAVDYARWHNFQQWLTAGERRVVVPFAEKLAELVLAIAVRQRRDFGALLTLICSHALLHRASRDRDRTGAIVATIVDYAAVRELVADVFAEGIEAMVSTTVRETVDAISALNKHEVSLGELAAKLTLDKSAASRRLRQATELGYLVNRETRSGRPARIALGDALPDEVQVLPDPDQLAASPSVAVLHYGGEGIVDGIVSCDDPEELTPALERAPEQAAMEDAAGIEDIVPSQVAAERIQHWFDARRT